MTKKKAKKLVEKKVEIILLGIKGGMTIELKTNNIETIDKIVKTILLGLCQTIAHDAIKTSQDPKLIETPADFFRTVRAKFLNKLCTDADMVLSSMLNAHLAKTPKIIL